MCLSIFMVQSPVAFMNSRGPSLTMDVLLSFLCENCSFFGGH